MWSDEFDNGLDPAHWTVEHSTYGDGNQELQCYHPDNVKVSGGALHLSATPQELTCPGGSARHYSSGMVRTRGLADWTYGRFEIRARIPEGQGLWPALWLSPVSKDYGRWPRSGELDIVEAIGQLPNRIIGSAHWYGNGHHELSNREYWLAAGSFADGMHTFTMDWSPTTIVWLVDGVEYHRLSSWSAPAGFTSPAPFDTAFYLKMNLAVGGRSPGDPDATTPWPASFDVDWVRVYQR